MSGSRRNSGSSLVSSSSASSNLSHLEEDTWILWGRIVNEWEEVRKKKDKQLRVGGRSNTHTHRCTHTHTHTHTYGDTRTYKVTYVVTHIVMHMVTDMDTHMATHMDTHTVCTRADGHTDRHTRHTHVHLYTHTRGHRLLHLWHADKQINTFFVVVCLHETRVGKTHAQNTRA